MLLQTIVLGRANEDRDSGWSDHIEYVDWIDDERILYCSRSGWITCRHLKTQTNLWRHQIEFKYAHFSLCRNTQVFAMLSNWEGEKQIVVIDCNSGEFLAKWIGSEIESLLTSRSRSAHQYCFDTRYRKTARHAILVHLWQQRIHPRQQLPTG